MRIFLAAMVFALGCGGDDADSLGIGAQCTANDECDVEAGQSCLGFKGGYCGLEGCAANSDCPENSGCVAHDDGINYCFRLCDEKIDCNANRDVENEANCSSSVDFVDPDTNAKACVPPS
jgi:hypothetical protein